MTTRKFAELRAKMSPESRERAAAKAEAMSREIALAELRAEMEPNIVAHPAAPEAVGAAPEALFSREPARAAAPSPDAPPGQLSGM